MTGRGESNEALESSILLIDDPADERIAAYRNIREKDVVGRQGCFVAEGKVVLNLLLSAARFRAESVLVLENRLAGLHDLLAKCPRGTPIYVAGAAVMDAVAGYPVHRGILAIGRRTVDLSVSDILARLGPRALLVTLCGIANHDNIGSIFRNAAAFGADAVLLDQTCCDPLYRKAIRVSVGAALKVPFARGGTISDLLHELETADIDIVALSPAGRTDIRIAARAKRLSLLLGSEGDGLPRAILDRLQTVRIPIASDFDSLNVATASGIALAHFAAPGPPERLETDDD